MVLASSTVASISLPKECIPLVKGDSIERISSDIAQETNGIASICSLLNKNLNSISMVKDENATKPIYLGKAIHNLKDLKKFDISINSSLKGIDKEAKRLNKLLRSSTLISSSDKQTIYIALAENSEDSNSYYFLRYFYIDGEIQFEKKLYYKKSLIEAYYTLSKKFGLVKDIIVSDEVNSENSYHYIVSATKGVYVRVSPSKDYEPIHLLKYKDDIEHVKYKGKLVKERGFIKIYFDNNYAWVANRNISKKD